VHLLSVHPVKHGQNSIQTSQGVRFHAEESPQEDNSCQKITQAMLAQGQVV
jgi:hypothetical protein